MTISKLLTASLIAGVMVAALSGEASATATMYGDLGLWSVAVAGSVQTNNSEASTANSIGPLFSASSLTGISSGITPFVVGPTGWQTWQGQTGTNGTFVYFDNGASSTDVTFNPGIFAGHPVDAFGMYIEPDVFNTFNVTLTLSDGATLTQAVNGDGGATFFGWVGAGISSFTISADAGAGGFAFGDFWEGFAPASEKVPEPLTLSLFGAGLAGAAAFRRRRKSAA